MNIQNFKLEQFDEANALVNILSFNLLQMCAHPLLDPTCSPGSILAQTFLYPPSETCTMMHAQPLHT